MVNVYTEYVKELLDYIYGLFELSPADSATTFEYLFDDYPAKVSQQQKLIDVLEKAGVAKVSSRIPLAPAKQIEMSIHGNEYSVARCAGYVLRIDKDAFMSYRTTTKLVKVVGDEHMFKMPHLSGNGRVLIVNNKEIELSKNETATKNMLLMGLIFNNDEYTCTEQELAETGGGKALENISVYAKNAVKYLNDLVEKEAKVPNFLRREGGLIFLNPKFLD